MGISKTDISATIISIAVTLLAWEILTRVLRIPGFILPAPSAIFVEAMTRYPLYLYHSWVTFYGSSGNRVGDFRDHSGR
jgi:ABC-type nitrate/sulfonate/bicarbonate transport system permease component